MKKLIFISALFLLIISNLSGQTYSHHNEHNFDPIIRELYKSGLNVHTSIRPYRLDQIDNYFSSDSIIQRNLYFPEKKQNIFGRFIFDDLFRWGNKENGNSKVEVRVNPLMNFQIGKEFDSNKKTWINTRGAMIEGELGSSLSFYVDIYENQAAFAGYMQNEILKRNVIPGQGRVKRIKQETQDYSHSSGYLSYNAGNWINLQAGIGKHFIGDGHRSLLLSDNTSNYPYGKLTASFLKVKYMVMFSQLLHIPENYIYNDDRLEYKYGAFHYLSWNITKWMTIGAFESVIYAAQDNTGHRGVDMMYIMPLAVFRPSEHAAGSPDNIIMGATLKITPWKNSALYGQIVINEFKQDEVFGRTNWWGNKQGFQVGFKNYNIFGINNLDFQTEYNHVRPYTYSHYQPITNYGHLNQELAHPLGANFKENNTHITYRFKRWYFNLQSTYAIHGRDLEKDISYGGNIFIPNESPYRPYEYGHVIGQGLKTDILYFKGGISFLINPKNNMNLAVELHQREEKNERVNKKETFFNVTLRTSLANFYWDY